MLLFFSWDFGWGFKLIVSQGLIADLSAPKLILNVNAIRE